MDHSSQKKYEEGLLSHLSSVFNGQDLGASIPDMFDFHYPALNSSLLNSFIAPSTSLHDSSGAGSFFGSETETSSWESQVTSPETGSKAIWTDPIIHIAKPSEVSTTTAIASPSQDSESEEAASASPPSSSNKEPYRCPICKKTLFSTRPWNIRQHMQTHDERRDEFPCTYVGCGASFTRKSDRRRHERDTHEKGQAINQSFSTSGVARPPTGQSAQIWMEPCGCILVACTAHAAGRINTSIN